MAQVIQIGARNATFQQIETLKRNREKRHKQGLFFVESVHAIEQAVYHRWQFEAICYARGVRLSGWARDMLSKAGAAHHYEMSQELMAELSDRDEPCELIALIRMRSNEEALEAMRNAPADRPRLFIAFDRPQNPGNLGSIIRSADAMGASGVIITGHGADLHDPLCVRSSIGAFFALPTAALGGPEDVVKWMDGFDKRPVLIGTSAHATTPVHKGGLSARRGAGRGQRDIRTEQSMEGRVRRDGADTHTRRGIVAERGVRNIDIHLRSAQTAAYLRGAGMIWPT